jgi:hypothetical protein
MKSAEKHCIGERGACDHGSASDEAKQSESRERNISTILGQPSTSETASRLYYDLPRGLWVSHHPMLHARHRTVQNQF